jgi:hypothetical protein
MSFQFPDRVTGTMRTMSGQEMWDYCWKNGIFATDQLSVEVASRGQKGVTKSQRIAGTAIGMAQGALLGPIGAAGGALAGMVAGTKPMHTVRRFFADLDRLSMFHARLCFGDEIAEAASRVDAAMYNYRNVTPFVDMVRTTGIIPFASWSAKNIPAQLDLFIHKPGQFSALMHAKEAVERGVPGVSDKDLPSYLDKKLNIVMYKDAETGEVIFRTLDNVIPMADLPSLGVGGAGEFLKDALGPVPKSLIALISDIDTFNKKTITKYDEQLSPILAGTDLPTVPVRVKNYLDIWAGRPLRVAEEIYGWKTNAREGPLKQEKGFWERGALVSAYTGVGPQFTNSMQNALMRRRERDRQVKAALKDAAYYRSRGQYNAATQAMKRAQEIQNSK